MFSPKACPDLTAGERTPSLLSAVKLLSVRDRTVSLLPRVSLVLGFSSRAQVRKLAPKCFPV